MNCKGKIFRLRKGNFITKTGQITEVVRFVPMKKLSCPGCNFCCYLLDDLKERDFKFTVDPYVDDGDLYSLKIYDEKRDWETGTIDEWEIGFFKL